jgi:hypothetical protein
MRMSRVAVVSVPERATDEYAPPPAPSALELAVPGGARMRHAREKAGWGVNVFCGRKSDGRGGQCL